nr:hypothetical protein [Chromobacterium paludis]
MRQQALVRTGFVAQPQQGLADVFAIQRAAMMEQHAGPQVEAPVAPLRVMRPMVGQG